MDQVTKNQKLRLLIVGLPNAGKSTLFNGLTGGNRKVSNYSGITVDAAFGEFLSNEENNQSIEIVDLPGIYNLNPSSSDEGVTVATLLGLYPQMKWDKIIVLLDYQRLEASLNLALSIKEYINDDLLFLINKDDEGEIKPELRKEMQRQLNAHILTMSASVPIRMSLITLFASMVLPQK
ncbi:MAG: FeoB small GTPase domain-containing protein [Peredibacter sp.]